MCVPGGERCVGVKMKSEKRHPILAFVRNRRRMIYGPIKNAPPRPSPCRRRETSFRLSRPRWTSRLGFARGGREVTTKRSVADISGEIIVAGPTKRNWSAAHFSLTEIFCARDSEPIFSIHFLLFAHRRARAWSTRCRPPSRCGRRRASPARASRPPAATRAASPCSQPPSTPSGTRTAEGTFTPKTRRLPTRCW